MKIAETPTIKVPEELLSADERIPLLLQTPAAVRWLSYEPALGPVNFDRWTLGDSLRRLDWIVVGGESGPGARPFDLAWARQTIDQCREAGIATFFKQAGSRPILDGEPLRLKDRKGGDMEEWSADLRVREYPTLRSATVAAKLEWACFEPEVKATRAMAPSAAR